MAKSLKNVINPDDVIREYGADSVRMYEMFMGPLEASKPWSQQGVEGAQKFLDRIYRLFESGKIKDEENNNMDVPNVTEKVQEEQIPAEQTLEATE
mgnify:CR=1 FL=1